MPYAIFTPLYDYDSFLATILRAMLRNFVFIRNLELAQQAYKFLVAL